MRRPRFLPVFALLLAVGTAFSPLASQPPAAMAQKQDYASLIGHFPSPGSDGAKTDLAILLWMQRTRTPGQIRRAQSEIRLHLGVFSEVTGRDLESPGFPLTQALAADLLEALHQVTNPLKQQFARPRPYDAFPQINPAVSRESTYAYPSGHSTWGMAEALLLAELAPDRREAILDRGRQIGFDRVLGGVHYPSDVDAGQRLGIAIAQAWLAKPAHQRRVEQARAEWGPSNR
ncbi:MAG: phosphatase PAP2 family protein [Holophaga sp.]|nr:phosphatase PAP2 family protein [Holophaga sp.]